VRRRAKLLMIDLDRGLTLFVHLGMTGRFRLLPRGADVHRHARVVFDFGRRGLLALEDMRKFGRIRLRPTSESAAVLSGHGYGPEPLDPGFTPTVLAKRLSRCPRKGIKAALLDQSCLAGIGNIYADESLWRAGIRPDRSVSSLKPDEIKVLRRSIVQSLKLAIRHRGTSSRDFFDLYGTPGDNADRLKAYGRDGLPCSRCHWPMRKDRVAGRGTHWCDRCQK
ncbi:bifunctional DNA-formamidopyrimidine glycosylase/DNA-(apurinic or apyrimidinic site) lyase, partial [Candidatus Uhrbacteria bacterium]|nr:bifunctional DNA-formamidopyrimidine glycosylase/DNA-(apurinic or apyrimidinic site) lyase [Candidatus Uhrbacteria bacterium]